jgi:hypothetical protein
MKLNKKLLASLNRSEVNHGDKISQITLSGPLMYKSPLNFWTKNTFADTHHTNHISSSRVQASFMHFHFHDKISQKTKSAIKNKQYFRNSANYITLDYSLKFMKEFTLQDESSRFFKSAESFWDEFISYNIL